MANNSIDSMVSGVSISEIAATHSPKHQRPTKKTSTRRGKRRERISAAEIEGTKRLAAIETLIRSPVRKESETQARAKAGQAQRVIAALDAFQRQSRLVPSPNEIGIEAYSRRISDLQDVKNAVIRRESPGLDLAKLISEHTESTMERPSKLIRKFHEEKELIATLLREEVK